MSASAQLHDEFAVWQGVYCSFAEAPREGPGFDGDEWCARSAAAARRGLSAIARGEALDISLVRRNALLPQCAATLLAKQPRLRVIDFGGGPGLGYVALLHAMRHVAPRIDYVVVDAPAICAAGEALFAGQGPSFEASMPEGAADIVHASSVLQYIDDWRGAVAELAACRPVMLSLSDVFAGPFDAFVTLQNYYGSRIPHWLLNLDELIAVVARQGYRLALRQSCHVEVLGRGGVLPMQNLPPALRIAHTQNLLFVRGGVVA